MTSDKSVEVYKSDNGVESNTSNEGVEKDKGVETYKSEAIIQLKLAFPLIVTLLSQFTLTLVAVIVCGHVGRTELDVVALATSMINVFGLSMIIGLATACETLFGQIYGYKNNDLLPIVLQRSLIILILLFLPLVALHLNMEYILVLMGQDRLISKLTAEYLLIAIPGLMSFTVFTVLGRYLQFQNAVYPTMIFGIIANVFNVGCQMLLTIYLEMGLRGSAISLTLSFTFLCALHIIYVYVKRDKSTPMLFLPREVFENWTQLISLALFGMLLVGIEWWTFEAGIIVAGSFGNLELATMSVSSQLLGIYSMILQGLSIASSMRISQYLGAGKSSQAKLAAQVSCMLSVILGVVTTVVSAACKDIVGLVFTKDAEVVTMVASVMPYFAIGAVPTALERVNRGVISGCGRQTAWTVFIGAVGYGIGLAISVSLIFYTALSVRGLWLGYTIGLFVVTITYCTLIYREDWEQQADKATSRGKDVTHQQSAIATGESAAVPEHDKSSKQHHENNLENPGVSTRPSKPCACNCCPFFVPVTLSGICIVILVLGIACSQMYSPYPVSHNTTMSHNATEWR